MILKLEHLTAEQYGKLTNFLTGADNQLKPPEGFGLWLKPSKNGAVASWVNAIQFARLVQAAQKEDSTFTVTVDVLTEGEVRVPNISDGPTVTVPIPSEPLIGMFASMSMYPSELPVFPQVRHNIKPIREVVECYRAGSGDFAVRAPNREWLEEIRKVSLWNYGRIQIIVQTEWTDGYNGYPGCQLWFYPGNKDGQLDENTTTEKLSSVVGRIEDTGSFGISTSLDEVVALRDSLTKAIRNMRARQKQQ